MANFLLLSTIAVLVICWVGVIKILGQRRINNYIRHIIGAVVGIGLAFIYFNLFVHFYKSTIHDEAWKGDIEAVRRFIEKGGDVNDRHRNSGGNILSYAVGSGNIELVEYLISKGATINDRAKDGSTPLHYVAREGHVKVVEFLISNGADIEATADLVQLKNWEEIAYGPMTGTPLHWAVAFNQLKVVETFLKNGAKADITDKYGLTPLHEAARQGNKEIGELLLKHGADVNSKTSGGITPLHMAVNENHVEMVRMLLENGADVNAEGLFGYMVMEVKLPVNKGKTPLSLSKSEEISKLLREYGANK